METRTDERPGLLTAAENVSDRRTLMGDGFWVSRKEMRVLDIALGRPDIGTIPSRQPGTYRTADGGVEVIVGIEESASWVEDQFPDEVEYLIRRAASPSPEPREPE